MYVHRVCILAYSGLVRESITETLYNGELYSTSIIAMQQATASIMRMRVEYFMEIDELTCNAIRSPLYVISAGVTFEKCSSNYTRIIL